MPAPPPEHNQNPRQQGIAFPPRFAVEVASMNQEFAGYSITRSMSGGGMTKLYVAIDAQQTRFVIRVLDAVMAKDRKSRNRFFHGGEVLARLHTPKPPRRLCAPRGRMAAWAWPGRCPLR